MTETKNEIKTERAIHIFIPKSYSTFILKHILLDSICIYNHSSYLSAHLPTVIVDISKCARLSPNHRADLHDPLSGPVLLLRRRRMRGVRVEKSWKDGAYTVRVQKLEEDRHLPPEAVIECVLTLPDTEYRRSRRIMYFHGG